MQRSINMKSKYVSRGNKRLNVNALVLAAVAAFITCVVVYLYMDMRTTSDAIVVQAQEMGASKVSNKKAFYSTYMNVSIVTAEQEILSSENSQGQIYYQEGTAFDAWPVDKKEAANAIWEAIVHTTGMDIEFACGIIGNMKCEGAFGLFQYINWDSYNREYNLSPPIAGGEVMVNLAQADVVCNKAGRTYGIGMIQWSSVGRKQALYLEYAKYAKPDGTLDNEALTLAEVAHMCNEIEGVYKSATYDRYQEWLANNMNASTEEKIRVATCIIFKFYEIPQGHNAVSSTSPYRILDSSTETSSIVERCSSAYAAYDAFAR